jgi:circadian clock protein KaiB
MNSTAAVQLYLFIASNAPRSVAAIDNIRRALAAFPERTYVLEIVNVFDDPDRALASRVLITPTLLAPACARRLVGDLSEEGQLHYFLQGLSAP